MASSQKNDNSHDKGRRAILKGMGITALGLGASLSLPAQWTKPLAKIGVLPAHAATSCSNPLVRFRVRIFSAHSGFFNDLDEVATSTYLYAEDGTADLVVSADENNLATRWYLEFVGDVTCLPDTVTVQILATTNNMARNKWTGDVGTEYEFPTDGSGSIGAEGSVAVPSEDESPVIETNSISDTETVTLTSDSVETLVINISAESRP